MLRSATRAITTLVAGLSLSAAAMAVNVGYSLGITTFYQFGTPAGAFTDMGAASPDTGFWTVTNTGTTTFSGTIGQIAVSGASGDFSYSHALTLAPGASATFAVNGESSNVGGFNGPFGSVQPGVEIFLTGLMDGVEAVDLHVFDRDIHSGAPRTNPFGDVVDSYVLQGGDPLGRDTGDDYEVSQSPGHFSFVERVGQVPEPATLALLGAALVGFGARRRKA